MRFNCEHKVYSLQAQNSYHTCTCRCTCSCRMRVKSSLSAESAVQPDYGGEPSESGQFLCVLMS